MRIPDNNLAVFAKELDGCRWADLAQLENLDAVEDWEMQSRTEFCDEKNLRQFSYNNEVMLNKINEADP